MSISSSIIDFLEYLEIEQGRTTVTAKNYDHYLKAFADFAKDKGVENPKDITADLIRKYRLSMNRVRKPISKATQNYYLIALRSFLKYLGKKNIKTLAPEKVELAKTGERQIIFLDQDELETLFSKPDVKTIQGLRDKAILELLFSTGLRVSELAKLKKEDINLDKSEFSVKGKGGKVRVVFVDMEAKNAVKQYLDARQDKSDYLFISYGHSLSPIPSTLYPSPITPRSIQRMMKKYALAAGITKEVTPHTMRHSFATDLLQNGADLRAVQKLLGHTSVMTTEIYTHVTDQHLKDVHEAFHGRQRNSSQDSS